MQSEIPCEAALALAELERFAKAEAEKKAEAENADKAYARFRDYLKHEDSLINWRLTWNLALQTALFAAFGWLAKKDGISEEMKYLVPRARAGITLMGLCMGGSTLLGVCAAQRASDYLGKEWGKYRVSRTCDWSAFPAISGGGHPFAIRYGRWASLGSVITLELAWLVIVVVLLKRA